MNKRELRLAFLNKPVLSKNPLISNIEKINNFEYNAVFTSQRNNTKENIKIIFFEFKYSIETKPDYSGILYNREFLNKLITIASKNAKKISKENFCTPDNDEKDQLIKLIERSINKSLFIKDQNYNILHLLSEIFFNMVISNHILKNGNKRMGMSVLIILLQTFGYYFKFSKLKPNFSKVERNWFWEKEVIKFFNLRNIKNKSDELIKEKIYKWIKRNSYFLNNLIEK